MTREEFMEKELSTAKKQFTESFDELKDSMMEVVDAFGPQMLRYEFALQGVLKSTSLAEAQAHAREGMRHER